MKKGWKHMLLLSAFTMTLAGCGSSAGSSSSATAPSTQPKAEAETQAAGPVTVNHDGEDVTLDKPAERVVSLEWTYTEDLVALGVQPVGNADNVQYKQYITSEAALDDGVTDVGTRGEPNLETIASLKPDLIIANATEDGKLYKQLQNIAPTIQFDLYNGDGYTYERMEETFNRIAGAVGKEDEAKKVLSDLDQHYADAKKKLEDAGKADFHYALTQAFTSQNAATLRMFSDNSVVAGTLAKVGMINDWQPEKIESYGFSTVGIEALQEVQDTNFLYITQPDDDIFGTAMADNKVWNGLNFVKEKRVFPLDSTLWTFGGPVSSKVLVDGVVGAIIQ
ncbi:ABC transporter substrate-binding protein [Saccharibacillus alkalitolerans]|uniref:Iron-siderophore ABC transporter substrate-binding protein n=1 Tax=Saccharibacillus alkalitolerans TaxID=2705290 RepID=A0ABX0FCJ9_9BACL|nr:iron-siderophore ABC transporter substrate-binding protein [Saccharibacillus alkalitolerans]NGZ77051.1 iron-siderophore ABC transporter substrate-binding protein [Saccharibacillus alkalitolerans]